MSNEYKDWLQDTIYEIILDNNILHKIEYCAQIESCTFVVIGYDDYNTFKVYKIWLDESNEYIDGWSYYEMK